MNQTLICQWRLSVVLPQSLFAKSKSCSHPQLCVPVLGVCSSCGLDYKSISIPLPHPLTCWLIAQLTDVPSAYLLARPYRSRTLMTIMAPARTLYFGNAQTDSEAGLASTWVRFTFSCYAPANDPYTSGVPERTGTELITQSSLHPNPIHASTHTHTHKHTCILQIHSYPLTSTRWHQVNPDY